MSRLSWERDSCCRRLSGHWGHAKKGCWQSRWKLQRCMPFSEARGRPVLCFAHVTNQMGMIEGDFEKGDEDGATDALEVIATAAQLWCR